MSPRETGNPYTRFQLHKSHLVTSIPGADTQGTYLSTTPKVSSDLARAAALTICAHARDVTDTRDLLDVCGLHPLIGTP